jgi:RNA polymerase sigma factor (sigma-70 family)
LPDLPPLAFLCLVIAMNDRELLERFLMDSDEDAFAEIVRRYGGLVAHVCHQVLAEPHAAEDAFQATFLVLLQNARNIRDWDALGRWLHGVAYRIAIRSKRQRTAYRGRECGGVEWLPDARQADKDGPDTISLLHEELDRLPRRLRDPILLCHFEQLTYEEAAQRLGRPLGTFKHQLVQGRNLLRDRLRRRGVAVGAMLLLLRTGRVSEASWAPIVPETVRLGRRWAVTQTLPPRAAQLCRDLDPAHRAARKLVPAVLVIGALAIIGLLNGGIALGLARDRPDRGALPEPEAVAVVVTPRPDAAALAVPDQPEPVTRSPRPGAQSPQSAPLASCSD